jgi:hypothetical protein
MIKSMPVLNYAFCESFCCIDDDSEAGLLLDTEALKNVTHGPRAALPGLTGIINSQKAKRKPLTSITT